MSRKPTTRSKPKATSAPATEQEPVLTVRHYCQGIGDCHLLTFKTPEGKPFRILIDCGIHVSIKDGQALVGDIVTDLKDNTEGGHIDILVVTHEHWDHVSGFLTANDVFSTFTVGEVWMAWTENPADAEAVELDKFKGQALAALQGAGQRLEGMQDLNPYMGRVRDGLQAVLGFQFGATGQRVRLARDAAAKLCKKAPRYFEPGGPPTTIPQLPGLNIYVLGPPRDKAALRLEDQAGAMFPLARGGPLAQALTCGLKMNGENDASLIDELSPFEHNVGSSLSAVLSGDADDSKVIDYVREHYSEPIEHAAPQENPDQSWRRIDADWMGIAADLALQIDRGVNNTSLVLAFEFNDRVFLFPGDAQIGNWLSWSDLEWTVGQKTVTTNDLLARTVYLKVAHHCSQNATPQKQGLDLMTSPYLSAFIPTNRDDAKNVHWTKMPYEGILTALAAKTKGRVIRADDEWLKGSEVKPGFEWPSGSILAVRSKPRDQARVPGGLWVELDLA
ncbi:hypothetical protein AB6802_20355 [Mesorhizobium sp. RCC_202]|uniref:hypothetical protein n=1 Tax=Mesorhizobium sp. RCC_202 TaxID=3239222 RepID=UPI0035233B7D